MNPFRHHEKEVSLPEPWGNAAEPECVLYLLPRHPDDNHLCRCFPAKAHRQTTNDTIYQRNCYLWIKIRWVQIRSFMWIDKTSIWVFVCPGSSTHRIPCVLFCDSRASFGFVVLKHVIYWYSTLEGGVAKLKLVLSRFLFLNIIFVCLSVCLCFQSLDPAFLYSVVLWKHLQDTWPSPAL